MTTPGKWCPNCVRLKPLTEFGVHSSRADGRSSWCSNCLKVLAQYRRDTGKAVSPPPKKNAVSYAHAAVKRALKSGRLARPDRCTACGLGDRTLEAHHHKGYDREHRLDVLWLCKSCHSLEHRAVA